MNQTEQHWQLFATISGIYIKSRRIAEDNLKPLGVTWPQFGALFNLNQQDNITQAQLAERMERIHSGEPVVDRRCVDDASNRIV